MSVKTFQLNSTARRLLTAGIFLLSLVTIFFAVKWYFGNSVATRAAYREVAAFAAGLAPDDPQAHYSLGVLSEKDFSPESFPKAIGEYETAAALAPNDFRIWLALGKARERGGDSIGAELALRRTLALAPNYAQAQWTLGNVLLRAGKTAEAFDEIRQAANGDEKFAAPAVSTAWQIFNGDLARVRQSLGDSPRINLALTDFLVGEKHFGDALEIWNALPADLQTAEYKAAGENIYREMLAANKYRDALVVHNRLAADDAEKYEIGAISNGGFENEVKAKDASVYEWRIADGLQPQIGFDDREKRGGSRSLVIIFNSADGGNFRSVSQTFVVESGAKYRFQTFYKSNLKTSATMKWEFVDASDGAVIAATEAVSKISDWTTLNADLAISGATEAVTLRLARDGCVSSFCPISGKIWFDDFSLIRQ